MGSRGRALRVICATTLTLAAWGPASFTLGAGPVHASSCDVGFSCAPSNVNFWQQGSYNLSGVHVCGIENDYAPVASAQIDANYDDPDGINNTNEGNYPDSEAIQFQPNSANPGDEVYTGSTIAVALPHPAEAYSNAGSILPPASEATASSAESSASTVTLVEEYYPVYPGPEYAVVVVSLAGVGGGAKVRLDAFDPYNPPNVSNAPGPNVSGGGTHANINGYDLSTSTFDLGQVATTNSSGSADFQINDNSSEDVVFGATDVSNSNNNFWLGVTHTATVSFNGGSSYSSGDYCQPSQLAPPSAPTGYGFTYILLENGGPYNNIGYVIPSVTVSSASGVERALLTVPAGVPTWTGQFTLIILDAVSPPGQGTPADSLSNPEPYPSDDFSVSTTDDPVPGFPSAGNTPTFEADASNDDRIPFFPVDEYSSPLTTSATTSQVGPNSTLTATATLNDFWNNPVNGKQVSVFQSGTSTHADIVPETPPTQTENPVTAKDGTVTFTVGDTCAETVNLEATDSDDQLLLLDPYQVPVQFTPAPPVPPDGTTTPTTCGVPSTQSAVTVNVDSVVSGPGVEASAPADGSTEALVNVTLGDQFGNADSCQQIVLSAELRTAHANITPLDPVNPCPGDNLPGYSGTDGKAQFDVNDDTAEQVVLGVADTTVIAIWPSSATSDPADVADINFLGGDAAQSTVVASPLAAPADGQPASTVTVTLKDSDGQVLENKNVTLAGCSVDPTPGGPCTADPTSTIVPSSQSTDSNGQATFEVADNSTSLPHVVYYQATDATDSVVVDQTASVTFMRGGASLGANPTTVVADGTGTSTLTFGLQDTGGNPVSGVSVSLAANPSAGATVSAPTSTGTGGTASFTVSDTQIGSVTFTATATYPSPPTACLGVLSAGTCTVKALVPVNFISPPQIFTITAMPSANIPADGVTPSQVTVTALDAHGNPIGGLPVSLAGVGSASGSPQISPASSVTGGNGQAVFSVTDATAETVTLTPSYEEIGTPSSPSLAGIGCTGSLCTATITFVETEAEASTVTVAPPASAPADGTSKVTVTVTLMNGSGGPLNGHAVVLVTPSGSTNVQPSNVGGETGISAPGQVSFTITDTKAESFTVYARDEATGSIINQMPTVTFLATATTLSTVIAIPSSLPAGGPPGHPSTTTVTVTLIGPTCTADDSGHTVQLSTPSATANLSPAAITSSGGVATFVVSDTKVEKIVLTAADTTCGTTLTQTATVTFVATESNRSSVLVNPISTPASGPAATLSVTLRSATGAALSGHLITVPVVGHATVTPLAYPGFAPGVTNKTGLAQFAITDGTVETLTLAAYDGVTELNQVARLAFTATEASQSTLTTSVTSLPAAGTPAIVTLTLHNGGGAPISGDTVSLSGSSPTNSVATITPATAKTNAVGQAQFTVGDARAQTVLLTALDRTTGTTVVQTVTLTFTGTEQNQSTVAANPAVLKIKKSSLITVTLLDPTGAPLAGHTVTISTGSTTTKLTLVTKGGLTNTAGQIQYNVTDTTPQVITIQVTDSTVGFKVSIYMTVTVTFLKT